MCGRYTLAHTTAEILKRFDCDFGDEEIMPSYNIAPTQAVPVIITGGAGEDKGSGRALEVVKWGLIPGWVKDLKKMKPLINARSEGLAEKPSFKGSLKRKRCIIPCDGFYEWQVVGGKKVPMRIRMKSGELFGLAGIFDDWKAPDGSVVRTCAIITVPANQLMSPIHDRMPAILTRETEQMWLDGKLAEPAALVSMLVPYQSDDLEAYQVSTAVNSPSVNKPELIEPAVMV